MKMGIEEGTDFSTSDHYMLTCRTEKIVNNFDLYYGDTQVIIDFCSLGTEK